MRMVVAAANSGSDGAFEIPQLPCGSYILSATSSGLAERRLALELTRQRRATVTVQMSLAPIEEQVTVTAETNQAETASAVAQRVNLIPRSALAERTKTVLTEAASGEAGLHELKTAPAMGAFVVRGLAGNRVSVYRDGFRYTTSTQRGGISTFQNLVDPGLLDSVEVLRGPNSAQYGSDSLGGTVNLLSTFLLGSATGFRGEASLGYGTAAHSPGANLLAGWGGRNADIRLTLAARRVNTLRAARGLDSHAAVTRYLGLPSSIFGARLPDTSFTQYSGSLHGQQRLGARRNVIVHYERGQQDGVKRYDQLLGGDGNLIAGVQNLMLDFGYVRFLEFSPGPFSQISAGASYNTQREERTSQGGQGNPRGNITHQYERTKSWGLNFLAEKQTRGHALVFGGEGYRERVVSPAYVLNPVTAQTVRSRPRVPDRALYLSHGLYAQDVWHARPWLRLSGAARFGGASYQSRFSTPPDSLTANAVTARAGASVRIREPVSVHAHWSRGFRAPNVTDLGTLGLQGNGFFEANFNDVSGRGATIGTTADDTAQPTGLPAKRLRPETSHNFDYGFQVSQSRLRAEFTAFTIRLGDTIVSQTMLLPPDAVGQPLGDQIITRQLASGAVFVPLSPQPVQLRANFFGARMRGIEHSVRLRISERLTFNENVTWIHAEDRRTGRPPDIEPGIPPLTANSSLLYLDSGRRFWAEAYATIAGRQQRLSSLALADRRTGAARSRTDIANYFRNGATARGLVADGRLLPTGETLEQVQNRVLGAAVSAPLFAAIPGYGIFGLRLGVPIGERADLFADVSNITDKSFRGIGWGADGAGRAITLRLRARF